MLLQPTAHPQLQRFGSGAILRLFPTPPACPMLAPAVACCELALQAEKRRLRGTDTPARPSLLRSPGLRGVALVARVHLVALLSGVTDGPCPQA